MSLYREFVNKLEKQTSRFKLGLDLAFRLRKFTNAAIGHSLYAAKDLDSTGEVNLLKTVGPHITSFMDIGANVGEWTNHLLQYTGSNTEGFLYEPSRCAIEKLESRFGRNTRLSVLPGQHSVIDAIM